MNALELVKEMEGSEMTIIDFWADWCGPCKMMKGILEKVASENPEIKIIEVNVDESRDLAEQFGVRNIPSLVFFKGDSEIERSIGIKSQDQIQKILDKLTHEFN
jgi:thioredoxin 1